jgi:hypothetical protein
VARIDLEGRVSRWDSRVVQLAFNDVRELYVNLQRSTVHVGIADMRGWWSGIHLQMCPSAWLKPLLKHDWSQLDGQCVGSPPLNSGTNNRGDLERRRRDTGNE